MKKSMKKSLCILLSVVLLAGVFPFSALADGSSALVNGKTVRTTPPRF